MKYPILFSAAMAAAFVLPGSGQTLPGAPEINGVTPKTATFYVNGTNGVNNLSTEAPGVGIANNGNVLVAWEDDGSDINDIEAVWTMFDSNGKWLTPNTKIDSIMGGISVTNQYLSFFRPDGSATPGYVSWGPKIHANLFGNGIGQGANGDDSLLPGEVASYAGYTGQGGFPVVQLFDNNGKRQSDILAGVSQAYSTADPGTVRIGDWEYLANGNIVIVGDSRQNNDLVNLYGGATAANHSIYRILTPAGAVVKAESLVNDTPVGSSIWHGVGVTKNGFAVRFSDNNRGTVVRMFDNNGNPTTADLVLTTLTGYPQAGGGGRGDGVGFHGNGKDAYVHAAGYTVGGTNGFWVTVLNTNGTVRWSSDVAGDLSLTGVGRGDAAITEAGEVVVVFDAKPDPSLANVVMGRRFDAAGNPVGGTFYVSEVEVPDLSSPPVAASDTPRVAWRNGKIAIVWVSRNDPNNTFVKEIAQRLFTASPLPGAPETNGLLPKTATFYVNGTNGVNNFSTEAPGVGIANNGNVLVAWEDDGSDINDIEAVWTMFDSNGKWLTPNTKIDSIMGGISVTNQYLSFFRPDGSATPGYVSWGPKIHANLFGNGIGQGANGDDSLLPREVASYAGYTGEGGFPVVQLFDNNGKRQSDILAGLSQAYSTADPGTVRIGDWEYLANGNIVIVGDSRQNNDLVSLYGGATAANHSIYRILTPAGAVVKAESLVNDTPVGSSIWHGVGVTKNGFAVRFSDNNRGTVVRMFDNNGNPTTADLVLTTLTGDPRAGGGGRGDGVGFHGNGKDAYVHAADYTYGGATGFYVTVLNTNGTVRWSRDVSDDLTFTVGSIGRGDAAIDESGQVVVVFSAKPVGLPNSVTMGRRFDATGNPLGGTFYTSEKEVPSFATPANASDTPRVAWRNGNVAIVWISRNDPNNPAVKEITQRFFLTGPPSLSISHTGNSVTISWPAGVVGFTLESSSTLANGALWNPVSGVVNNSVTVLNPSGRQFYRLRM